MLEEGRHTEGCLGWCLSGRGDRTLGGRHFQAGGSGWEMGQRCLAESDKVMALFHGPNLKLRCLHFGLEERKRQ